VKFSDGFWNMRPGVSATHPLEVIDAESDGSALTIFAATKRVRHRGDTLNAPLITIEARSPMPDVISVRIVHHAGERTRTPAFELEGDPATPVEIDEAAVTLRSGALQLAVDRQGPFALRFTAGGRPITSSEPKAIAVLETDDGHYIREQLSLGVDEHVYGLGERFGPLIKNGQTVDIWNADGGTASEQAYKNVPFFLSDNGYGVLVNDPGRVSFEVASEVVSRAQFSVQGQELEYFVIYGPGPKEVLRKYSALAGRPALPPAWSFGLWLSTSFTTNYDEATVTSFVDGMAERDLPLSVVHFDTFWMREFRWCDFEWDPRMFPDPAGMLRRLKERGLRVCVWINPYIAQRSPLFDEGKRNGFLLTRANGDVWQWDKWQAGMALVDFTNPAARSWYADKLRSLLDMGVDCFKSDFGERVPTDAVYHDGSDPERMHNYYSFLYNRTVFELLEKYRGPGEAVVFARSATVGGQRFPVHWGGDNASTFPSMAESLRGGLSLAVSGFGYWSHDIGGFEGTPDPAVFKRWIPFGLLSSHSRLHGNESYRVPWAFDDESVDVLREFTKLKLRLMPYLYDAAVTAHREGIPMLRPMVVEFPDDPASPYLDRQYMLGDNLLVAPVFSADGATSYYVPAGEWTHVLTGAVVSGPGWVRETHDFRSAPVLVRPNSVIALGSRDDVPDYAFAEDVTLLVSQLADGADIRTTVPTPTGEQAATFRSLRAGDVVEVQRSGSVAAAWNVLLVGVGDVEVLTGQTVEPDALGTRVRCPAQDTVCRLRLPLL
jgi:alpha-D-xyloside xylohydrolase